jgi:hypothetical protein
MRLQDARGPFAAVARRNLTCAVGIEQRDAVARWGALPEAESYAWKTRATRAARRRNDDPGAADGRATAAPAPAPERSEAGPDGAGLPLAEPAARAPVGPLNAAGRPVRSPAGTRTAPGDPARPPGNLPAPGAESPAPRTDLPHAAAESAASGEDSLAPAKGCPAPDAGVGRDGDGAEPAAADVPARGDAGDGPAVRRVGRARRRPGRSAAARAISSADGSQPTRPVHELCPMRAPRGISAATRRK